VAKHITSFEIRGYRALGNLRLSSLCDVNLFVGKNSTGKTTLLEAISIFLCEDLRPKLYEILVGRDEFNLRKVFHRGNGDGDAQILSFESLFYGRPNLEEGNSFSFFSNDGAGQLDVEFKWLRPEQHADASLRYSPSPGPDVDPEAVPGLKVRRNGMRSTFPLDRLYRLYSRRLSRADSSNRVVYLPSSGLAVRDIGEIWDAIALTDDESLVIDALQIIVPSLEKLVMVQSPESNSSRMLMAKLSDFSHPVPFKSLGEGAMHLLSVTLAMIRAKGGTILIDEIASGIHYSVQRALWGLIAQQSYMLNVQVFATTHSLDCVRALSVAHELQNSIDVALFRLESFGDIVKSVRFASDELAVVSEEGLEIR
jgi:hypothetical protein